MELVGGVCDEVSELCIKGHHCAATRLTVEEKTFRYAGVQGFFDAQGLGAELDLIGAMGLGLAPLVFNHGDMAVLMKLDHITDAMYGQSGGANGEAAGDADAGAGFVRAVMGAIVHGAAFGGEAIFRPDLVNVDQGALPGAEEQMLEARDRE